MGHYMEESDVHGKGLFLLALSFVPIYTRLLPYVVPGLDGSTWNSNE